MLVAKTRQDTMRCLSVVLLVLIVDQGAAVDPVLSPATLTDSALNTANSNSTINWSPMPSGIAYKTDATYDDGGMGPLFNFARSFVNSVFFDGFPYELISDVKDGRFEVTRDYMTAIKSFGGYAACIVIGFLFIFIFTIVGCCFCCCRCCGNCGGKMQQKSDPSASCRRKVYAVIFLVLVVFSGVGCICIYVSNDRMTTSISTFGDSVASNLDDVDTFMNNTIGQVKRLLQDDLTFTFDVLFRDLDNLNVLVGIPVRDKFNQQGNINSIFTQVGDLQTDVDTVVTNFDAVYLGLTNLKANYSIFDDEISYWITNYDSNITTCAGPCSSFPNASGLTPVFDPNNIDMSSAKTEIENIRSQDMSSLVQTAQNEFNNIPERVKNESATSVADLKTTINNYKGEITPMITKIENLQKDASGSLNIASIKKTVNEYSDMAKPYDKYRWYGGVGLTSIVLLIVLLQFLGLAFGVCGSSADTLPNERSCLSHAGGNMLMASVGFTFIFSWMLMLLTTTTFMVGAPLEKFVCEPLSEPGLATIEKLIQDFGFLGNGNESFLGKQLFNDGTVDLTIGKALQDCGNGLTSYSAFKLQYLSGFNLSLVTNYKSKLDVDSKLSGITVDFSTIEIAPASLKDNMQNFKDSIKNMNFSAYTEELDKNASTADLGSFIGFLNSSVQAMPAGAQKISMEGLRDELININDGSFANTVTAKTGLKTSMDTLEPSVGSIPGNIDILLKSLNTTQEFLNSNGSAVLRSVLDDFVVRVFRIADALVNRAVGGLQNDIAKCTPVYNLYQSLIVVGFCKYIVDAFNGFWFCIGWCLFFFVPSTIFAVKLAKHFRKMNVSDSYDDTLPYKDSGSNQACPPPSTAYNLKDGNKVGHSDKF